MITEKLVKWLMVMVVTGSLVILLQFLALVHTRSVLMDVLRLSRTYQTPDTEKTPTSEKSSPAHR
jgi:hypothetical protein